jgi:CRISPR-associated endoribonuclease Cas6
MKVFQIRVKLYLLQEINVIDIQERLCSLLDETLSNDSYLLELHQENKYKNYTFSQLFPIEPDKLYKKGKIYTLTIRTVNPSLTKYFSEILPDFSNDYFKGLEVENICINQKILEKIYSITPCIIKDKQGYWKKYMTLEQYEERIKVNLVKKYNYIHNTEIDENFQLFTSIIVKNRIPIGVKYKDITLLGDKIQATVASNIQAQVLCHMALGTGILENNARGSGFINFRYL